MTQQFKRQVVIHMETDATRKYPFSKETLDKMADIRRLKEQELNEANPGEEFLVPAPIVLAEAVDMLHEYYFE
ncbi:hypothetical protein I7C_045c [Pseudomonas phage MR299-2]|nr:hypothetical protein I7C_045c [Pseudomonas phage MR299-2]